MPSSRTTASREKDAPRNATATAHGIFKKWDYEIGERTLWPGDTLALYSDGITESFNEARDEFGEAHLIDSLRRHRSNPPNPFSTPSSPTSANSPPANQTTTSP